LFNPPGDSKILSECSNYTVKTGMRDPNWDIKPGARTEPINE
jgi:hypothetical protein